MAIVIEKIVPMSKADIIRYQLFTYCFVNSLKLSEAEIECLALLELNGECDLSNFLKAASADLLEDDFELEHSKKIFKSSQTVRNFLTRAEKDNLIEKTGSGKKRIKINPSLNIQSRGSILLNLKVIHRATEKS